MPHPLSPLKNGVACMFTLQKSTPPQKKLHNVSSSQPTFPSSNERLSSFTQSRSGHLVARTTDRRAENETCFPPRRQRALPFADVSRKISFHPTLLHDICPKYCMLYAWRGSSATFIAAAVECGVWRGSERGHTPPLAGFMILPRWRGITFI